MAATARPRPDRRLQVRSQRCSVVRGDSEERTDTFLPHLDTASDGMQTWQIVLIICCATLVFAVAVSALLSCYCKTRRRLNESENSDNDAGYYHPPPTSQAAAAGSVQGGTAALAAASRRSSPNGDSGLDYYESNRQLYAKAPPGSYGGSYGGGSYGGGSYNGSYNGSESRYTTALGSDVSSPDRISPPGHTRPSAGSIGEASTPYASDRRRSSVHSQAVTL